MATFNLSHLDPQVQLWIMETAFTQSVNNVKQNYTIQDILTLFDEIVESMAITAYKSRETKQ